MPWEYAVVFVFRCSLVMLFVPFSAFYMLSNFRASVEHTGAADINKPLAAFVTLGAIILKVACGIAIITGYADRLAAISLSLFCLATAIGYKRFWGNGTKPIWHDGIRLPIFWEFWKNIALASAFALLALGFTAEDMRSNALSILEDPLSSSRPYQ